MKNRNAIIEFNKIIMNSLISNTFQEYFHIEAFQQIYKSM